MQARGGALSSSEPEARYEMLRAWNDFVGIIQYFSQSSPRLVGWKASCLCVYICISMCI